MSDQPEQQDTGAEPGGDYSYDLAHDVPPTVPSEEREHDRAPSYVVTQTSDEGGDYSYDLAHDIPPPGRDARRP